MHGGNYLHWLVTARVNSHLGKLGPGNGFRPFRTKGDDGGRHRRRRQVNRVLMSWRFDRHDFPDLVVLHVACGAGTGTLRELCPQAPAVLQLRRTLATQPEPPPPAGWLPGIARSAIVRVPLGHCHSHFRRDADNCCSQHSTELMG